MRKRGWSIRRDIFGGQIRWQIQLDLKPMTLAEAVQDLFECGSKALIGGSSFARCRPNVIAHIRVSSLCGCRQLIQTGVCLIRPILHQQLTRGHRLQLDIAEHLTQPVVQFACQVLSFAQCCHCSLLFQQGGLGTALLRHILEQDEPSQVRPARMRQGVVLSR